MRQNLPRRHASADYKMAAQRQNDQPAQIGGKYDDRNKPGKQSYNAQPQAFCFRIGREKFFVFQVAAN